ncbi:Protein STRICTOSIDINE SYNTHASE-LIKE 7 [Bienertia sinuspersici]
MLRSYGYLTLAIAPIILATVLYNIEPLEPAHMPLHELTRPEMVAPRDGQLVGPEDVAYDPRLNVVYTGCSDGWIKRVMLNNSVVDDWVYVGGRPLGVALGLNDELIVVDPFKVELLTDEVEGRKLKFADGVDVAKDGMIYFTEASYKYSFLEFIFDVFEGKPHGSLMSFDPITRETKVLVRDLYFANGIQVSADQKSVIFCETTMKRCKKYIREGEMQGSLQDFVHNLPGMPDNIRYDEEGHYWIAFSTSSKPYWDIALKYPLLRKALTIITRHIGRPHMEQSGGLFAVDLEGKEVAHYYDPKLTMISGGNKIGKYLYFGSLYYPSIMRLNLDLHAAK